jgi:hypothetical protein
MSVTLCNAASDVLSDYSLRESMFVRVLPFGDRDQKSVIIHNFPPTCKTPMSISEKLVTHLLELRSKHITIAK